MTDYQRKILKAIKDLKKMCAATYCCECVLYNERENECAMKFHDPSEVNVEMVLENMRG